MNKKLRQASNVREWLKATEDRKRRAPFDDEKGDEDARPVKRLRLTLSAECGGSVHLFGFWRCNRVQPLRHPLWLRSGDIRFEHW